MISSITPGTPTHSNTTGLFGVVAPTASAARQTVCHGIGSRCSFSIAPTAASSAAGSAVMCPCCSADPNGDSAAGSTTTSAPQLVASARRPAERSLAITVRTPDALSMQITDSPIGPQPITTATVRLFTSLRRMACQATAMGSVRVAR